ncbi:hypothetical protein GPECTOR_3g178 [Gonium pectorale]|uniref:Peptidase S8/S53 domain-containing protein n=1 Tax=Gonium pectorale TaxID=33097 RepID=A0A150GYZ1_GONPE|nr:hypothetical protein GPECTOR_3g178 [Gonium pectorale]|eukprot:KXZ55015.1 hypothetical protein GPECTOR_3g178 [Gonium pectorale]
MASWPVLRWRALATDDPAPLLPTLCLSRPGPVLPAAAQADQRRIREEEEALKRRAQEILVQQQEAARSGGLPFKLVVRGTDFAPLVVWAGIAAALYGAYRSRLLAWLTSGARRQATGGKWVYDRSLGGRKVWVPDSSSFAGPTTASSLSEKAGRSFKDEDFERLASFAAAARTADPSAPSSSAASSLPAWWDPPPVLYASEATKAARAEEAARLLARIESAKISGRDYALSEIRELRRVCQSGHVTVRPKTVGAREGIFRTAVEAAVEAAQRGGNEALDDASPGRWVTAVATDLGMEEGRAVEIARAAAAVAARGRLLDAVTNLRSGSTDEAVFALARLAQLLQRFPALERGGPQVSMVASQLAGRTKLEEREAMLYLLLQLYEGGAGVAAELLGFDPQAAKNPLRDGAPLRLVVAFLNDVDVADLVPPILKQYTSRVQLALSNLQILEAVDEAVLDLVMSEIRKRTDIDFLVRDFVLKAPSSDNTAGAAGNSDTANSTGSGGGARRLQQQQQVGNGYSLDDPGLSATWWFNKINVTGAWQLLRVNATSPQTQSGWRGGPVGDVIIAVTDSGALVSHPDLLGSWWTNPDELDNDLADNDNNTFIDDYHGACFSTRACSPTYPGNNVSRCGIGANTSAWNGITDRTTHGTKIAGVIGARPNNGIGLAGVAPNLRQMILKVTDESLDTANPPYAYSDVVRAVDYAYGKGARIFSMSFGPDARYSKTSSNKPGLDEAASAYSNLFQKYSNALFVAAAGNEWTSLDGWRSSNYTYPPCMVDAPNVMCVGGTNASDALFYVFVMNAAAGTNFGANTVDLGAPAHSIYTTDIAFNNFYSTVSGTSFSTPIVAAVAGLVLTALGGQTRATPKTPLLIKNILMTSGDLLPGLQGQFRSARRLNAGNAVAAALTLASTNRTTMRVARSLSSVNTSTVMMPAWEYSWWSGVASSNTFDAFDASWSFIDFYVRNQPTSNFNLWRYGAQTLTQATAFVRIDTPGLYSVQARAANIEPSRWQLTLGESVLVWNMANSTTGTVDLLFPNAGYYNMTLWIYVEFGTTINFLWQTPGSNIWTNPSIFWSIHDEPPSSRFYDPGVTPRPALWHVVWNEAASFDDFTYSRGYFAINQEPRLYRQRQTTVPDFSYGTGTDLRNGLYGTGGAPSNNQTVVYGYARANLRPLNYSTGVSFRLQGPHTRLYIDGQNVFDFQSETQLMIVTPCITLSNNTAHEIFFYFAARVSDSRPVGLTWATCTGTTVPAGTSGAYLSMTGSLATNFFWQPTSTTGLPRGFRCDAWPTNQSVVAVGTTPPFGTPPRLTWMYPRDCPTAYRAGSECRMQTRLVDLFPNVTWNNWHIRCFTYYSGSIANGVSRALNLNGPVFQHLAGVRAYEQWGNSSFANFAPYGTRFGSNVYQLYVIEWVALGQMWNRLAGQTIWDGTTYTTNGTAVLTTNSASMILPSSALGPLSWQDVTSAP